MDPAQQQEDFTTLHGRVLKFMGAFATLQFAIDSVVQILLRRRLEHLGPAIDRQFLQRVRDDQRLPLLEGLFGETDYGIDIKSVRWRYERAKETRDLVGHSLGVVGPVHSVGKPPFVGVVRRSSTKHDKVPEPLLPSSFDKLGADCEWISQHIYRAAWTAIPDSFVDFSGKPSEPPQPPKKPDYSQIS